MGWHIFRITVLTLIFPNLINPPTRLPAARGSNRHNLLASWYHREHRGLLCHPTVYLRRVSDVEEVRELVMIWICKLKSSCNTVGEDRKGFRFASLHCFDGSDPPSWKSTTTGWKHWTHCIISSTFTFDHKTPEYWHQNNGWFKPLSVQICFPIP